MQPFYLFKCLIYKQYFYKRGGTIMTRRNKILATISVMILFAILPMTVTPSSATPPSPPTMIYGSDSYCGQISTNSGVVIENQSVVFDLLSLPLLNDENRVENTVGNVQTSYSLYNPTDSEITFTVALPVSNVPEYLNIDTYMQELDKYSFSVNGKAIESPLRYGITFGENLETVGLTSFIYDDYISDEYCSPDMTVTKYTFTQSGVNYSPAYVGFDVDPDTLKGSCLYLGEYSHAWDQPNGDLRFSISAGDNGCIYEIYVFGNDLTELPDWKVYKSGGVSNGDEIEGTIELVNKETIAFSEVVSSYYYESLGINEIDWYNMAAKEISSSLERGAVYTSLESLNGRYLEKRYYLACGFIYDITVEAGERVKVSMDAPLYPSIETKYEPNTYDYHYYLFVPQAEMFTGKIDVTINTPYYMTFNGHNEYTKTENGYSLTLDAIHVESEYLTLMPGSVFFTLCEVESPEKVNDNNLGLGFAMIFVFIMYAMLSILEFIGDIFTNVREWISGLFSF